MPANETEPTVPNKAKPKIKGKNSKPVQTLARPARRSIEWQIKPGLDTHPLIDAVITGLERLTEVGVAQAAAPAVKRGTARAVAVQEVAGASLLTILAFGDESFSQVSVLMQSLGFVNEQQVEDPETGLDAVFVFANAAPPALAV